MNEDLKHGVNPFGHCVLLCVRRLIFSAVFCAVILSPLGLLAKEDGYGICYLLKQNGADFYLSDGSVSFDGNLIGDTKQGCLNYSKHLCSSHTRVDFRPNLLRNFDYSISRVIDTCKSRNLYFKGDSLKEIQRLIWSIPYVENIVFENNGLRHLAEEIVSGCAPNDVTCKAYRIYRHVVTRYEYKLDGYSPEGDLILTPFQTLEKGGGDCEDLTSLTNSLLENVGVKTFMNLTDDHAYGLVCGIDPERLREMILDEFRQVDQKSYHQELPPGATFFIGGTIGSSDPFEARLKINATGKLNVYGVPDKKDYQAYNQNRNFSHYQNCVATNVAQAELNCRARAFIGWVVSNQSDQNARVELETVYTYQRIESSKLSLKFYSVNGKTCAVLESTAGKDGYPGFSVDDHQVALAIDPKTWDWYYLK